MPRSEAQSDFSVSRPRDLAEIELPAQAMPVALPRAQLISSEASELATRWVLRATMLVLFALAVLCLVGPHIPSGE
jgi:hypothetical protein